MWYNFLIISRKSVPLAFYCLLRKRDIILWLWIVPHKNTVKYIFRLWQANVDKNQYFLIFEIEKWISNIRKWISNIRKWISNIRNSISNIWKCQWFPNIWNSFSNIWNSYSNIWNFFSNIWNSFSNISKSLIFEIHFLILENTSDFLIFEIHFLIF